jgi:hypothetical protein
MKGKRRAESACGKALNGAASVSDSEQRVVVEDYEPCPLVAGPNLPGVRIESTRPIGHGIDYIVRLRRAALVTALWKNPEIREENMKKSGSTVGQPASELIDKRIAELGDWRGKTLSRMRKLIKEADPDVVEEWKWMGTPTWSHDGIICTGESYKSIVKLTFTKGASLKDPARLFNSSLDGNVRRAIDIREGEEIDAGAFKALIRAAVALNTSRSKARPRRAK